MRAVCVGIAVLGVDLLDPRADPKGRRKIEVSGGAIGYWRLKSSVSAATSDESARTLNIEPSRLATLLPKFWTQVQDK